LNQKVATFAERLRELLDIKRITQAELCRQTGISKSSMSHYVKGDWEGKQDSVYAISRAMCIDEAWLMGFDVPMDKHHAVSPAPLPKGVIPLPETKLVPLIGTIACGSPALALENPEDKIQMPGFVHADFALRCKGDSMITARIFDGDIVYIKQQPVVDNGEIAAVLIGDETTLKKVYYTPGSDRIVLQACNPMYPDMVYSGEQLNEIEILGKAVWFASRVRT